MTTHQVIEQLKQKAAKWIASNALAEFRNKNKK
jgi:hypothetical protein